MKIREIIPEVLFAIEYDDDGGIDIYRKLFEYEWNDLDGLIDFFEKYQSDISSFLVEQLGIDREDSEQFAMLAFDEAINLEKHLRECAENSRNGCDNGLVTMFKPYGGKYDCVSKMPCKCYGDNRPPLLRLYAIEITASCYLLVYGGIKLKQTIQESPVLCDEVDKRFDAVRSRLAQYLVEDGTDLKEIQDEDL